MKPTPKEIEAMFEPTTKLLGRAIDTIRDCFPEPRPEKVGQFAEALGALAQGSCKLGWESGYAARQVRERESFVSAHGERTKDVIMALLAIARRPTNVEDVAIASGVQRSFSMTWR